MARKDKKIISNDDGWIMSNMTSPVTPQTIKELMIDTYAGAPIGAVSWCVGNSETYEYETEVGERTGDWVHPFCRRAPRLAAAKPPQSDRLVRRPFDRDRAPVPRSQDRCTAFSAHEQSLRHPL